MKQYLTNQKIQIIFVCLTAITAIFYTLMTNHIWEDFYITFRHSKNLVDGNGLVFQPGERVHGFTSVINTLLPALFYWISGKSFLATIWLYRIASIAALIFGGWYFLRELQKQKQTNLIIHLFFTLFFAFQAKTIMFASNGQEAGFMILFLLPSLIFAFNGYQTNWKWAGICWAGLIYTRPDGVVYIMLISIASFTFGNSSFKNKQDVIAIIKVGLLCAAVYLPWFIWAWVYYGSPIPHTITAKSTMGESIFSNIIRSLQMILSYPSLIGSHIALPTNYQFGGWPYWVGVYGFISWVICSIYWLIPSKDQLGRYVSFIYFFLVIYFSFLHYRSAVFSWYFPPAEIMAIFILSSALYHLPKKITSNPLIFSIPLGILILLASTNIFFKTVTQISIQQEIVENGHRKQIGLWLKDNINKNDSVFLEPLGYIGYFSNAKMLDWPGLVSPEVVAIAKAKGVEAYPQIIKTLKPNWVILRPVNIPHVLNMPGFKQDYKAVKIFSVKERLKQYKNIAGMGYLLSDSEFVIFKRNSDIINLNTDSHLKKQNLN